MEWLAGKGGRRGSLSSAEAVPDHVSEHGLGKQAPPFPSPSMPRKMIQGTGKYDLMSELGRGASAKVYKARRTSDEVMVAIKVIDLEDADKEFEHFRSEVLMLSQCKSPNVITYYESQVLGSELWVVMEYLDGGSVVDHLSHGGLSEEATAVILKSVLKGLDYLHKQAKLHRDIKCANVLLSSTGAVKLADFGVAAQLQTISEKKLTFAGTPLWMAPEVIEKSSHNEKADIWSLGITAMEMILGKPPLSDKPPLKVLFLIPNNPAPRLSEPFSKNIQSFVERCLRKDPSQRPSTSELLRHKFIKSARKKRDVVANMVKKWKEQSHHQKRRASFSSVERNEVLHGRGKDLVLVEDDSWDFSDGSRRHSLQLSVSSREGDLRGTPRRCHEKLAATNTLQSPELESPPKLSEPENNEKQDQKLNADADLESIIHDTYPDHPEQIQYVKEQDQEPDTVDRHTPTTEARASPTDATYARETIGPTPMETTNSLSQHPGRWHHSTPASPSSAHAGLAYLPGQGDSQLVEQYRSGRIFKVASNDSLGNLTVHSDGAPHVPISPARSRRAMSEIAPSRTISPTHSSRARSPDSMPGAGSRAGNYVTAEPQMDSHPEIEDILCALSQALSLHEDEEKREATLAALRQVEGGLREVVQQDRVAVEDIFKKQIGAAQSKFFRKSSSVAKSLEDFARTNSPAASAETAVLSDNEQHWAVTDAPRGNEENATSEEEKPSLPHHQGAFTLFSDTDEEQGPVLSDPELQAKITKRSRSGKKKKNSSEEAVQPSSKMTMSPLKITGAAKFFLARLDGVRRSAFGMGSNIVPKLAK